MNFLFTAIQRWYTFATAPRANAATAAIWIGSLGGIAIPLCLLGTCALAVVGGPHQTTRPTDAQPKQVISRTAPSALPTSTPTPTMTVLPRATATTVSSATSVPPTSTLVPPSGTLLTSARLRETAGTDQPILGTLCKADQVRFRSYQDLGSTRWYQVQIVNHAPRCTSNLSPETIGWVSGDLVSSPDQSVATYAHRMGIAIPTARAATAVPTARLAATSRPTARPAAPASSGMRVGAVCRDGSHSSATGRGACSHHGGVAYWLTR